MIKATLYSDPACPWAYSESPALRVIEWRYGDQLDWKLIVIGLTEDASQYVRPRIYAVAGRARVSCASARYGMPFSPEPKERVSATARACRAIVAARQGHPGSEWRVYRALQLRELHERPWYSRTTSSSRAVLAEVPGGRCRRGDRRRPRLA